MDTSARLLVVDDDIEMASNLKDIFESEGYIPVTANDARTAISLCSEHIFDLGVVDIKLPDMTGIELIEKLSQLSKKMKFMIITGNASLESAIEAVKLNKIVSYTLKPLDMNYFIPLLQHFIEQKHKEEALFKVEQEIKAIFKSISEPVAYQDKNHKLVWINNAAKDSVGMSYDKIIGRRCYDALIRRSEPCTGCPSEKIIETGLPHENEMTMPDGHVWSIRGYPVRDKDDKIIGIVETIHNITERKKSEQALQKTHKELEKRVIERTAELIAAQEQIIRSERLAATGQLAASVAHEINSPLQAITVLLGTMKSKHRDNKELSDNIVLLKGAFYNIKDTVKNLMDLNRPGNEYKQMINVNAITESTVALMKSHLKNKNIKIDLDLSPTIPDIIASPLQLGHVFLNLINNAVEAMSGDSKFENKWKEGEKIGGEISIKTLFEKDHVVIQVSDTGPGIAEDDLEHIFDSFFTSKKTMGMGVGLSICNVIIEDHNGIIEARNAEEGGAVFTVTLPVNKK